MSLPKSIHSLLRNDVHLISSQDKETFSYSNGSIKKLNYKIKNIANKKIIATPMEAIPFTTYQERKFRDDGGFVNEVPNNRPDTWTDDVMIYWTESFEDIQVILDGVLYTKFALFKKIYESLPEYLNLSQSDAEKRGLYPIIHYRNFWARHWLAKEYGGHLAILDSDYKGELFDIYYAAEGKNQIEKLAYLGQVPFGWHSFGLRDINNFGQWVELGAGSFDEFGNVPSINFRFNENSLRNSLVGPSCGVSSIIVRD